MVNSATWPTSDDDPFQQQNYTDQQSNSNDLSSSWQNTTSTHQDRVPKWMLQTDEERADQQKVIHTMESKLKRVKRQTYSETARMNYNAIGNSNTSDREDEDDTDEGYGPALEDHEGLPLLWHERYTNDGLDEALLHQKKDRQYLYSSWWDSCCMCCCRYTPTD